MALKEMVKVVDNTKKHPEERQYLICIRAKEGTYSQDCWDIVIGRTAAYEYIKENIDDINMEHSFVLVESVTLSERKSIYAFMKYAGEFYSDGFDIEDYIKGDWDESDYMRNNDITPMVDNKDRIDMASFLNGEVDTKDLN